MKAHIVSEDAERKQRCLPPPRISVSMVAGWFNRQTFEAGSKLYKNHRVINFERRMDGGEEKIECQIIGREEEQVSVLLDDEGARFFCSCTQYERGQRCAHIAAALLAYANDEEKAEASGSDANARKLMNEYLKMSQSPPETPAEKARLVPRLSSSISGYPSLVFQVGREKLYVVRNIEDFLRNVIEGKTTVYGKGLTLCHEIEQFDEASQALIRILMNEFPQLRSFTWQSGMSNYYTYSPLGYNKNEIVLQGTAFDRFFELYLGHTIAGNGERTLKVEEKNPSVVLAVRPESRESVMLETKLSGEYSFFGNSQQLYAESREELLRCSAAFRKKVWPLVLSREKKMKVGRSDLPTFCSCVLPEIEELVAVEDEKQLLQRYTPDECLALYYLDWKTDEGLTATLECQYGEAKIQPQTPAAQTPAIKRNLKAELAAARPLEQYFRQKNDGAGYELTDEKAILDFLSDKIEELHRYGEVYISDRIRNKRIDSKKAAVGISVAGDILTLDIDTGEFPAEELQALYQSLLQKKRYYRLKDGRFLTLDGSPYEKMAEIAQMTQLAPRALKSGHIKLPAYRGLYLEKVLEEGSAQLSVKRSADFKTMVRGFKEIEDGDFPLPPHLTDVLRPYQKIGFQWLKTLEKNGFGGILADEMGLGKTLQMLAFLCTAPRAKTGMPSLVICPASLILNWADELKKFAPQLKMLLMMGTAAERKQQLETDTEADVWVTSYDLLRRDSALYEGKSFYACVLDEGQNIKNQSTVGSKAVKQLVCRQRFIMTGTPIENRLSELWNLFDFLMPGYLFSNRAFVDKLEKPIVQSQDALAQRQLSLLVQPFILRRLKKDVLKELPPKIEHIRRVALTETERKVYLGAVSSAKQSVGQGKQNKLQILAMLTRLRQICCDPNLCFENYEGESSKLEACIELCSGMVENGHQILLFSQFTSMLARIEARIKALNLSCFKLEGATPKEQRAKMVREFNAGKASIFLISLKAGGTGLNLTAADVVIHYDPWWNLAAQDQATDRAHRMGQQHHVQVYKLIAKDTIEEKILQLQEKKAGLMETLSGGAEDASSLTKEEILALLD